MVPILLFRPNDGSHLRKAFEWTSDLQDLQAPKRPNDASRMAKRWFKSQPHWVPSHKAAARFGSRSPRFCVPQKKWGRKRRHFHVPLELNNDRRICWCRPGAASSAEQRFKIHRSFRRDTTLLEKRRRRMGLESRVASPSTASAIPSQTRFTRATMSLLTDTSSARSTSARTASRRKPRPRRSRPSGAFAPTPCGASAARRRNRLHRRRTESRHRKTRRSDCGATKALRPRPEGLFHLSTIPATKINSPLSGSALRRIRLLRGESTAVPSPRPTINLAALQGRGRVPALPQQNLCAP